MRTCAILAVLALIGCAHAPGVPGGDVEVSWQVCAVSKVPNGDDIDDGGVDVMATLRSGRLERVDAGHYPGSCWREAGELSRIVCADPHIDVRYVLQWIRPSPSSLAVERLDYALSDQDGVPDPTTPRERRTLRTFEIPPATRVIEAAIPRCGR
jgi:hypothetical protein